MKCALEFGIIKLIVDHAVNQFQFESFKWLSKPIKSNLG